MSLFLFLFIAQFEGTYAEAQSLLYEGRNAEACQLFRLAYEQTPSADAAFQAALLLTEKGNYGEAMLFSERSLRLDPEPDAFELSSLLTDLAGAPPTDEPWRVPALFVGRVLSAELSAVLFVGAWFVWLAARPRLFRPVRSFCLVILGLSGLGLVAHAALRETSSCVVLKEASLAPQPGRTPARRTVAAGTRFHCGTPVRSTYEIRLVDGVRGWLPADDVASVF